MDAIEGRSAPVKVSSTGIKVFCAGFTAWYYDVFGWSKATAGRDVALKCLLTAGVGA